MKNYLHQLLFLLLLLLLSHTSFADINIPKVSSEAIETTYPDSWHLYLAPYFWLAGINGYFKTHDRKANFNNALDDLRHNLDFGAYAQAEISRSPWSILLDSSYTKFTQNVYINNTRTKATLRAFDLDGGAYYQVLPQTTFNSPRAKTALELFGGGRIMTFDSNIYYYNNAPTISDTSGFLVPIVGARIKLHFNDKLSSWINGDFGGFQMNHVASTWSGMIGLNYSFTQKYGLSIAYRALGVHYYKKSTTINTIIQGPMLGLTFTW